MSFALMFPGQASQEVGMGTELRSNSAAARDLFAAADRTAGLSIGELCASGPLEELTRTRAAQVAVVTTSLAASALFAERAGDLEAPRAVAGHSVGEIAAMCAAGALDPIGALELVSERGRLMERDSAACDGTMVAILGLDAAQIAPLCAEASGKAGGSVQIANLNAPGQIVLSGGRDAIAAVCELAMNNGARRALRLNVGGPFHSIYMQNAARDFGSAVDRATFAVPRVPIVLNTNAEPTIDIDALRAELPEQISVPVRWEESVRRLGSMGCTTFIELGAGSVLTGLVKRILPDAVTFAAGTPRGIDEAVNYLRQASQA